MLTRTALALLLLLPATVVSAQDIDTALSALVRISGTRGGTPVRGSGFVVALDGDKATIVTASHVIEGVQQLEVTFAVDRTESFPAGVVLGMEAGNPRGLATFQVRGRLPPGVTTLRFEDERQPGRGTTLFLLGFPQIATAPRTTQRVLSDRNGPLLLVDQDVGEGFSGGPVLLGGKVVGVVTDTDDQTTYAVNSVVARAVLEGWGVSDCLPGDERTENEIVFVRICPGTFTMGSAKNDPKASDDEKPPLQVTLSEFWIAKTEVTNKQYRRFQPHHKGKDDLPATGINWFEAKAACEHFGGRLPTEAEWEYAARAGSQTAWSFGDDETMLREYAWFGERRSKTPHPVGKKKPNAWGLYDMHGNVWEWVADWYGYRSDYVTYEPQTDPAGPKTGEFRVVRGGSCDLFSASSLRSASRFGFAPDGLNWGTGFRCVRAPHRQP